MSPDDEIEVIELAAPAGIEVVELGPEDGLGAVELIRLLGSGGGAIGHRVTLDDLVDVDAPPGDLGVLTRSVPGGHASFVSLPEPPAPPPVPQRHQQATPAARWQIVHDLGWRPHFDVHTADGRLLHPDNVEHPVPGSISELVFGAPFSGYADPS